MKNEKYLNLTTCSRLFCIIHNEKFEDLFYEIYESIINIIVEERLYDPTYFDEKKDLR